jgi:hypothetical protein
MSTTQANRGAAIDLRNSPHRDIQSTMDPNLDRMNVRAEFLMVRNRDLFPGARVLDIACHDGRFSWVALELGAAHVTGIEPRPHIIGSVPAAFAKVGYGPDRCRFECADAFEFLAACEPGQFDVILCFAVMGLMLRPVEMFHRIARLNAPWLILDVNVIKERRWLRPLRFLYRLRPKHLTPRGLARHWRATERDRVARLLYTDPDKDSNTVDPHGFMCQPTAAFVETLIAIFGYEAEPVVFTPATWSHMENYRDGREVAWLCRRSDDPARLWKNLEPEWLPAERARRLGLRR